MFVGDTNSVEPSSASERRGYEVTAFWRPITWLGVDAVYTGSRARYAEGDSGRIEGAVEHAALIIAIHAPVQWVCCSVWAEAAQHKGGVRTWEASLRMRYRGPYALVPENTERAASETHVNLRAAYTVNDRMTFYGELLNVLDEDGKDIIYWYEAYVDGVDPPGMSSEDIDCSLVNCRMSRAEEPRTLRFGLRFEF